MRIDTRAGSEKLIAPLRKLGLPVEEAVLDAGDVEILGNGPNGPVLVGVEYKTVDDAFACVRNGRFAEQLRGMRANYEISWLLLEGRLGGFDGREGVAIRKPHKWYVPPGRMSYQEFVSWTMTMAQSAGVMLWRTEYRTESVLWLKTLNTWWTAKEYEEHRAHLDYYRPPIIGNPLEEPSYALKMASILPHIGSVKAAKVSNYFGTIEKIACATEDDWVNIPGVGKKSAGDIVRAIREG